MRDRSRTITAFTAAVLLGLGARLGLSNRHALGFGTQAATAHFQRPVSNGVIAFVGGAANASLDTITPSGTRLRTLAYCRTTSCFIGDYVWSHDGRKIAFLRGTLGGFYHSNYHSNLSVFVVNANGTREKRLASCGKSRGCLGLDWSPDDSHLVMARSEDSSHASLLVLNLKTHVLRQLTHCGTIAVTGCDDISPRWSPDGSRIAFHRTGCPAGRFPQQPHAVGECFRGAGYTRGGVYVVNVDGSGLKKLSNTLWNDASPSWSPDSRQIAFGWVSLFVVNADGSHLRKLRQLPMGRPLNVAWDPSGARLLYTSTPYGAQYGQTHTWLIRPNGTGRRLLYPSNRQTILWCSGLAGYGGEPCLSPVKITWSPDGKQIAFSARSDKPQNSGLFIMHADGTHIRRILPQIVGDPAWQPLPRAR